MDKKLLGNELFKGHGVPKDLSVLDFWQYAFSNLNSNIIRGILAEFIIETALRDKEYIKVRNPWGDCDVTTSNGAKIEVKCSAYIQDWPQAKPSKIIFTGLKAKDIYWSSEVSPPQKDMKTDYKSDIYVLAMLINEDKSTLDPLDLDQWRFFVLSKDAIRKISNNGNSLSLSTLAKSDINPLPYPLLSNEIECQEIMQSPEVKKRLYANKPLEIWENKGIGWKMEVYNRAISYSTKRPPEEKCLCRMISSKGKPKTWIELVSTKGLKDTAKQVWDHRWK